MDDWCSAAFSRRQNSPIGVVIVAIYGAYQPIITTISLIGNGFCLGEIIKLVKKGKPGFWMQAAIFICDVLIALSLLLHSIKSFIASPQGHKGPDWYQQSYVLVWVETHIIHASALLLKYAYLLLVLFATFHKISAVKWPIRFKFMDHKVVAADSFILSIAISAILHWPELAGYSVRQCTDFYFKHSESVAFRDEIVKIREIVRIALTIALLVAVVALLILHKDTVNTVHNQHGGISSKLLSKLMLTQAVSLSIGAALSVTYYLFLRGTGIPDIVQFMDAAVNTTYCVNVVFYLSISSTLRRNIMARIRNNTVQPLHTVS